MKADKPIWLKGIVTLKVVGHYPERFFDLCRRHGISIWSIKKQSDIVCIGDVYLSEIHKIRQLRRKTHYKITFPKRTGFPFFFKKIKRSKSLIISLLIALIFFFYLTQAIWLIEITGTSTKMEANLVETLKNNGVKIGKIKYLIDNPLDIQQKLLNEYPEILWVGVVPEGITYRIEVIEKQQEPKLDKHERNHLYAKKDGVINKLFVSKGRSLVSVNDFVRKGQLLVTGELNHLESDTEEDEKERLSSVEAEIYATTWYESKISIPLEAHYQTETGESINKYKIMIGSYKIPIWGLGSTDFVLEHIETTEKRLEIGSYTLPISLEKNTHKEITETEVLRSKEEAIRVGLDQTRDNLLRQLDSTALIIDEKVLQRTTDNGKINLHIYFTVNENIVNTID